jgi:hypothetical protein
MLSYVQHAAPEGARNLTGTAKASHYLWLRRELLHGNRKMNVVIFNLKSFPPLFLSFNFP